MTNVPQHAISTERDRPDEMATDEILTISRSRFLKEAAAEFIAEGVLSSPLTVLSETEARLIALSIFDRALGTVCE
jgi:hypothetical protein